MGISGSLAHALYDRLKDALECRPDRRRARFVDPPRPVVGRRAHGLLHIGATGELELQGLDALIRLAIGARDPAALEPPVEDHAFARRPENRSDRLAKSRIAARP